MLYAEKGNKILTISEEEKLSMVQAGFDIVEEIDGERKTIEYGHGKTVPYAKYDELLNKVKSLEAKRAKTPDKVE